MKDTDLRRRASRHPMRWEAAVVFDHVKGKPIVQTQTRDLSSSGAAIFSEHGDVTGSIVHLLLAPPGRKSGRNQLVLKARARVVSTVRTPGMSKYRHGLSFLRSPDDGLDLLDEILGAEAAPAVPSLPRPAPAGRRIGPLGDPNALISLALAEAHRYLRELVPKLNVAHPAFPKRYAIVGVPEFEGLAWSSGSTSLREQRLSSGVKLWKELSLSFRLSAKKQIRATREYPANEKLRRFLQDCRIEFSAEDQRSQRGMVERTTFVLQCEVPANLVLEAQFEIGKLKLRASNVCGFGLMEQMLAPEAITAESLSELGAFILGEARQLGPLLLKGGSREAASRASARVR